MAMEVSTAGGDLSAGDDEDASLFPIAALREARNPWASFFHLLFKFSAILFYFFCTWFTEDFVMSFIVCLLLLAVDFWVVKNISGRLLVGMRWSNEIKEDGSNEWKFECIPDTSRIGGGCLRWPGL